MLGVNLGGVINGVATFVPRMKERGQGGHIVNTASMASFLASGMPGIYNCSKFAVRGLSEFLRHSLHPHGIGVSVLCPGLVNSEIYRSDEIRTPGTEEGGHATDPGFVEMLGNVHKFGMDPVEVAEKVVAAIRANRFYIFSHPEFKDELREVFDQILENFTDETPDPQRLAFEQGRRSRYAEERALAQRRLSKRPPERPAPTGTGCGPRPARSPCRRAGAPASGAGPRSGWSGRGGIRYSGAGPSRSARASGGAASRGAGRARRRGGRARRRPRRRAKAARTLPPPARCR